MTNKVINDPIHGNIELEPLLVTIIDTPQFQRLRFIKQLGGTYFVYPGASHNRFEHSIGVCHLAGRLVKALRDQKSKALSDVDITDGDILCVKIAALCHDLGHGPFSHVFDGKVIPRIWKDEGNRKGLKWTHEQGSVDMFNHMLEENKGLAAEFQNEFKNTFEKEKIFIQELIVGPLEIDTCQTWPYKGRTKRKAFLYEIVSNKRNGIDVDKWDYFARDCHSLGIGNNFTLDRCIAFSRVIEVNGEQQICYRDKEASNLYDMFHTRLLLHQRAYQHKAANIIEYMVTEALALANNSITYPGKNGKHVCISETIYDMEAYTLLTDDVIYRILRSNEDDLAESKRILNKILKRDLYSFVGEKRFPGGTFGRKDVYKAGGSEKVFDYRESRDVDKSGDVDELRNVDITKAEDVKLDFQRTLKDKSMFKEIIGNFDQLLVIDVVDFNYGKKGEDPVSYVNFYSKNDLDKAVPMDRNDVSLLLPNVFEEQVVRIYCRAEDKYDEMRKMFNEWAKNTSRCQKK